MNTFINIVKLSPLYFHHLYIAFASFFFFSGLISTVSTILVKNVCHAPSGCRRAAPEILSR